MLWNKVTSSQVVSSHRKNFKWMKFNCKKPILNITLKTISLLLLRKKTPNPHTALCSDCSFFLNQTSEEKLFSLLKIPGFFWPHPPLTQGREKSLFLLYWLGIWRMERSCVQLTFPLKLVENPDFHGWLKSLASSTEEERKRAKQSAVSPFVSVVTKPIPFSPFWCYSFMWYVNGVSFGICFGGFFPFF